VFVSKGVGAGGLVPLLTATKIFSFKNFISSATGSGISIFKIELCVHYSAVLRIYTYFFRIRIL
jgi:hypothetical protein